MNTSHVVAEKMVRPPSHCSSAISFRTDALCPAGQAGWLSWLCSSWEEASSFPLRPSTSISGLLGIVGQLVVISSILFAQVYRYLWVSTSVQRQQTKWVVFGIMAAIIYFLALLVQ